MSTVNNTSYLSAYFNSVYYPVCADNWSASWTSGVCTSLGLGTPSSMTSELYQSMQYLHVSNSSEFNVSMLSLTTSCPMQQVVHVKCNNAQCGTSSGTSAYIVGGEMAVDNTWPWAATLLYAGEYRCTAVVLGAGWLMTAGHCIIDENNGYSLANLTQYFAVRTSATKRTGFDTHLQVFGVKRIVMNPGYTTDSNGLPLYDIALVQLGGVLLRSAVNTSLTPVCLPDRDIDAATLQTVQCYAVGWGLLSPNAGECCNLYALSVAEKNDLKLTRTSLIRV